MKKFISILSLALIASPIFAGQAAPAASGSQTPKSGVVARAKDVASNVYNVKLYGYPVVKYSGAAVGVLLAAITAYKMLPKVWNDGVKKFLASLFADEDEANVVEKQPAPQPAAAAEPEKPRAITIWK